jgi:hypothetical protein
LGCRCRGGRHEPAGLASTGEKTTQRVPGVRPPPPDPAAASSGAKPSPTERRW